MQIDHNCFLKFYLQYHKFCCTKFFSQPVLECYENLTINLSSIIFITVYHNFISADKHSILESFLLSLCFFNDSSASHITAHREVFEQFTFLKVLQFFNALFCVNKNVHLFTNWRLKTRGAICNKETLLKRNI